MLFKDRADAGRKLLTKLSHYRDKPDVIVIGLPRGGVVTAYEIAQGLGAPLDVTCPRKIGAPFNPELAIGAVTETGQGVFNRRLLSYIGMSEKNLEAAVHAATVEATRRSTAYHRNHPPLELRKKVVILVDDGLATGATMKAAIKSIRAQKPTSICVAVPVAPPDTLEEIREQADEVVCLYAPFEFRAVGEFYYTFGQTTDEEVIRLLSM